MKACAMTTCKREILFDDGAFFSPTTIEGNLISLANEKLSPINNLAKIKINVFNFLKVKVSI